MTGRIRVLRIVEYVGPREWVESTVRHSIHGTINVDPMTRLRYPDGSHITAITLGEFGESIADSLPSNPSDGFGATCTTCGKTNSSVVAVRVQYVDGSWGNWHQRCEDCRELLRIDRDNPSLWAAKVAQIITRDAQ